MPHRGRARVARGTRRESQFCSSWRCFRRGRRCRYSIPHRGRARSLARGPRRDSQFCTLLALLPQGGALQILDSALGSLANARAWDAPRRQSVWGCPHGDAPVLQNGTLELETEVQRPRGHPGGLRGCSREGSRGLWGVLGERPGLSWGALGVHFGAPGVDFGRLLEIHGGSWSEKGRHAGFAIPSTRKPVFCVSEASEMETQMVPRASQSDLGGLGECPNVQGASSGPGAPQGLLAAAPEVRVPGPICAGSR